MVHGWARHAVLDGILRLPVMLAMACTHLLLPLGSPAWQHGTGTGNTALAAHAGRLLALHEGDLPYALRVTCSGLVDTIGRVAFE